MSDNAPQPEPASLAGILRAMNEAGQFQAVVLASADGLPIATTPAGYDSDLVAALVAMLRKVSGEAQSQLGLAEIDEVTVRSRDQVCLVCRRLDVGTEELILVVIVPPGRRYRRATNQAIAEIERLLS
jgi:predicted regulator of Ras-like GTPase activity (Roadblock/LC7/MglB family)